MGETRRDATGGLLGAAGTLLGATAGGVLGALVDLLGSFDGVAALVSTILGSALGAAGDECRWSATGKSEHSQMDRGMEAMLLGSWGAAAGCLPVLVLLGGGAAHGTHGDSWSMILMSAVMGGMLGAPTGARLRLVVPTLLPWRRP